MIEPTIELDPHRPTNVSMLSRISFQDNKNEKRRPGSIRTDHINALHRQHGIMKVLLPRSFPELLISAEARCLGFVERATIHSLRRSLDCRYFGT